LNRVWAQVVSTGETGELFAAGAWEPCRDESTMVRIRGMMSLQRSGDEEPAVAGINVKRFKRMEDGLSTEETRMAGARFLGGDKRCVLRNGPTTCRPWQCWKCRGRRCPRIRSMLLRDCEEEVSPRYLILTPQQLFYSSDPLTVHQPASHHHSSSDPVRADTRGGCSAEGVR
jgi:hypothetical protein